MSDEGLLRSAARGDEGALSELIRELAPEVYRYLAGMLGDPDEAAPALQEVFVRMARAVERYEADTGVRPWVYGIARRVVADLRPTPAAPPGEPPADPDEHVAWTRRALRALPPEDREVLVAHDVLRWDPDRIGEVVGCASDDVPGRVTEARTRLVEAFIREPSG